MVTVSCNSTVYPMKQSTENSVSGKPGFRSFSPGTQIFSKKRGNFSLWKLSSLFINLHTKLWKTYTDQIATEIFYSDSSLWP